MVKGSSGSSKRSAQVSLTRCWPKRTWRTVTVRVPAGTVLTFAGAFQLSSGMPL
jgi:hypothetical protein